jgi:hypothetical protein
VPRAQKAGEAAATAWIVVIGTGTVTEIFLRSQSFQLLGSCHENTAHLQPCGEGGAGTSACTHPCAKQCILMKTELQVTGTPLQFHSGYLRV